METNSEDVKYWLNNRFRSCDDKGVYIAHQPIYGFRKQPSELGHINRYIITHRILDALQHLEFNSLLDVGGAEGYKAFLVQELFHIPVTNSDLSEEACNRAKEIFGIESIPADIHNMQQYVDEQFDIVMCSETLEHVTDWKQATSELLRVAKKAVVISVPQECIQHIERNKANNEPHAHIHHFDSASFNYLMQQGYDVKVARVCSSLLVIPSCLVDGQSRVHCDNWMHPKVATQAYNMLTLITKKIFGERMAEFLIWLDRYMCMLLRPHRTNLYIILKHKDCYLQNVVEPPVSIRRLVAFAVPHHYLHGCSET